MGAALYFGCLFFGERVIQKHTTFLFGECAATVFLGENSRMLLNVKLDVFSATSKLCLF